MAGMDESIIKLKGIGLRVTSQEAVSQSFSGGLC
jgi:hypothetical protein